MSWISRFLNIASTALQKEDLRQRFIYAPSADELPYTPGIVKALETTAVLAIYEASFPLRSAQGDIVAHERPYPGATGHNPKRADLAFKAGGPGRNWHYIEVKKYSAAEVRADIEKLQGIEQRARRWLLVYRGRAGRMYPLRRLLETTADLDIVGDRSFDTFLEPRVRGTCELVLGRVSR